jgi:hypothetical protein
MGVIGIVLASVVGLFWHSDGLQFVISVIGVMVFTGLAAYDAQRLRSMALTLPTGETGSYAIVGALALYLDFINLFLFLLRFLGNRRERDWSQRRPQRPSVHHVAAHEIVHRFEMRNVEGAHRLNGRHECLIGTTCRARVS